MAEEVVGEAAVEGAFQVGGEEEAAGAGGGWTQLGLPLHDAVQELAVVGGGVFDVVHVLQTAFDFEGGDAGVDHGAEMVGGGEVAEREEVLVFAQEVAVGVVEVVGGAAGLRTAAAVAAAVVEVLAEVALAAVADAEGPLDKGFQLDGGVAAYVLHLLEGGLAGQDDAAEADTLQKLDARQVGVVGLGAGMELDGRQVAFQQAEVLDDGGIDSGVVELVEHADGILYLVVEEECVDGGKDACVVEVGVLCQPLDVRKGVAGGFAGTESRGTDVDGVGTVVDGFASLVVVFGGGEEL